MALAGRPTSLSLQPSLCWPAVIERLGGAAWRVLAAGQVLVAEGRPSGSHVLDRGALLVSVTSESGLRAGLDVLGHGDLVGRVTIGHGDERSGRHGTDDVVLEPEVRALVRSRVLSFPPVELSRLIEQDPGIAAEVIRANQRREARLGLHLAWALTRPVTERVLATLEELADRHGRPLEGGRIIDLPLSQELLAGLVGASRESVNRALSDLRRREAVWRRGRAYVMPDHRPEAAARIGT
jgi:CRP/FNR family cyclic AMP-dependent transcriptional regulator